MLTLPLRVRKVVRDLGAMRGRVAVMIVALAASVAAVGAVGGARAILEREIRANYLATHPASATLAVPAGAGADALDIARSRPGVLDAALRTRAGGRMLLASGRRVPVLLFVAPADDPMRVAGFTVEQGHWPPASGELLLERSSAAFFGMRAGERIDIQTRSGRRAAVRVGGLVHDGALSPSDQEGVAYGFATPELLARLGEPQALDALKIVVGDGAGEARGTGPSTDVRRIDAVAQDVGSALRARGVAVTRIDAPPPLRHPHQSQMETALAMLMTFAVFALLLGAVLAATMIGTMLAQQMRQIGVMKTLGASDATVFATYMLMAAAVAGAATLLALVPSVLGAHRLAAVIGGQFGIDLASLAIPLPVFAVEIAAGVLVPAAVALVPLVRGTSVTVREAIDGAGRGATFGTTPLQAWLGRRSIPSRTLRLALRNVLRRPGRLALVTALLGASGAVFVTAMSTAAGIQAVVEDGMAHRHYDVEARLSRPEDPAVVARVLAGAAWVAAVETSESAGATVPHDGRIDLTRTYPDGGHGSFAMTVLRPGSPFVRLPLVEGRALAGEDANAVVFNQPVIPQQAHGARVGESVALSVNGRITRFTLAGVVSDFGNPATAYVTAAGFARATGEPARVSLVRVVTRDHDGAARAAAVADLQRRFAAEGIALRGVVAVTQFKVALVGHAQVLANTITAIAVVMAIVGILGLASAIGSGVMERTREFGVLRSVGASAFGVAAIVVTEGLLYGAFSAVVAVGLSIPLTLLLDGFVGTQAFLVPLPFVLSPAAVALSAAVAPAAAAAASAAGARAAARLTVREALAAV